MCIRIAILLFALLWATPTTAQTEYPLRGSGSSQTTDIYAGATFDYVEYEVFGQLTVLGPFCAFGSQLVDCTDGVVVAGEVTFSDAAGAFNTLTLRYAGVAGPDGVLLCIFTMTAGTGRYEGATGEGLLAFNYSPQLPFDFALDGVLYLP